MTSDSTDVFVKQLTHTEAQQVISLEALRERIQLGRVPAEKKCEATWRKLRKMVLPAHVQTVRSLVIPAFIAEKDVKSNIEKAIQAAMEAALDKEPGDGPLLEKICLVVDGILKPKNSTVIDDSMVSVFPAVISPKSPTILEPLEIVEITQLIVKLLADKEEPSLTVALRSFPYTRLIAGLRPRLTTAQAVSINEAVQSILKDNGITPPIENLEKQLIEDISHAINASTVPNKSIEANGNYPPAVAIAAAAANVFMNKCHDINNFMATVRVDMNQIYHAVGENGAGIKTMADLAVWMAQRQDWFFNKNNEEMLKETLEIAAKAEAVIKDNSNGMGEKERVAYICQQAESQRRICTMYTKKNAETRVRYGGMAYGMGIMEQMEIAASAIDINTEKAAAVERIATASMSDPFGWVNSVTGSKQTSPHEGGGRAQL